MIDGSNFGQGSTTTVHVGGNECTVSAVQENQISCAVGGGVGKELQVIVNVTGLTASSLFSYEGISFIHSKRQQLILVH